MTLNQQNARNCSLDRTVLCLLSLSCFQDTVNIKIHHIHSTARQRNVYILTIWLVYTTPAAYKVVNCIQSC